MDIHDWHFVIVVALIVLLFAGFYLADVVQDSNAWRRASERARHVMRRQRL
jgi:Ni,Fe-hydrogenase I cytochrome b subunit